MANSLVLTVIGPDKPGLVSLLSDTARRFGANWLESRMATLGGQFAGIVHLQVAADRTEALIAALRQLETRGLQIMANVSRTVAEPPAHLLVLELVAQDRPGIVRDVSLAIAAHGVSIEQLDTDEFSAPHSGEAMFRATARLRLPWGVDANALRATLEDVADDLMVDITLDVVAAPELVD